MHQETAPDPPSLRRPDLPPSLDAILLRALAKSPDDRFQSAAEMAAALRRAMTSSIAPPPVRTPPSRPALVAIASLVAVAGVLTGWFLGRATAAPGQGAPSSPPPAAILDQPVPAGQRLR